MDERADKVMRISAKSGIGFENFAETLQELLSGGRLYIDRVYPYDQGGKVAIIRQKGQLISEQYVPEGIAVKAYIPLDIYGVVD